MDLLIKVSLGIIAAVVAIASGLLIALLPYWLVGSLATSGIKAVAKDCGKHYGIERYLVVGDWFCP
jgi:hypothetical protein